MAEKIKNLFSGRIDRKHWFLGWLLFRTTLIVLGFLLVFGANYLVYGLSITGTPVVTIKVVGIMLAIAILIPYLILAISLHIRRIHDVGKPIYYLAVLLIPFFINWLMLLYLLITKSDISPNKYGEAQPAGVKFWDDIFHRKL